MDRYGYIGIISILIIDRKIEGIQIREILVNLSIVPT